jgi:hypothetical protein
MFGVLLYILYVDTFFWCPMLINCRYRYVFFHNALWHCALPSSRPVSVSPVQSSGDNYGSLLRRLPVRRLSVTKLVRITPHKLLVQFHLNFTGMISTMFSCAHRRHFSVQCFCQSNGPLMISNFNGCRDYSTYTANAISMKSYMIDLKLKSLRILHGFSGLMIFDREKALE